MSANKRTDAVCIAIVILMLITTVLFINGKKLGLSTPEDTTGQPDMKNASVISLDGTNTSVSGNGAYFSNNELSIIYAGTYILSGTLDEGSVTIDAKKNDDIIIVLDSANIGNSSGPAIYVKQAKSVSLYLKENSSNIISCGKDFTDDSTDGAVYSKENLNINGSGSLTVNADYKHGIVCNDTLSVSAGNIKISASQDALHANDGINISGGEFDISAGDDGMTASNDDNTSAINITDGNIRISSCYEGIESNTVNISGGNIDITSSDDGINASGNGDAAINISGGNINIINKTGMDADGLDSNGNINISGGTVFISMNGTAGMNNAIDFGSESGGKCTVSGGVIAAFGSSQMAEALTESSQGFIMKNVAVNDNDTQLILSDINGKEIINKTIPCGYSLLTLSSPDIIKGETYTLTVNGETEDITVDNTYASNNFNRTKGSFGRNDGETPSVPDMQETPSMPENGEMPSFPDNGERPQMPENGVMPSFPDNGERPQMPENGEMPFGRPDDGNMPTDVNPDGAPGTTTADGQSESDNFTSDDKTVTKDYFDKNKFNRQDFQQNFHNEADKEKVPENSNKPSIQQLILVAASILSLAAGILITAKKKY